MNAARISRQRGLTLIEVMIALTIGLFLLGGTIALFVNNKRTFSEQDQTSRLQENARFALDLMVHDIRMAGYFGCAADSSSVYNILNGATGSNLINSSDGIEGSENAANWQPSGVTPPSGMTAGTDALTVRYLDPSGISISEDMPSVSSELKVNTVGDLQENEIVAISDCKSTNIFQLTRIQTASSHLQHSGGGANTPGNDECTLAGAYTPGDFCNTYSSGAEILRYRARRYYIGTGASGIPALFRVDVWDASGGTASANGTAQEIAEGIENLQLLYGEDTNDDNVPDSYVDASTVTNWDNVVAVKLGILARSPDEYGADTDAKTYNLFTGATGCTVGADSGCVASTAARVKRRVYSTTVEIRNRTISN